LWVGLQPDKVVEVPRRRALAGNDPFQRDRRESIPGGFAAASLPPRSRWKGSLPAHRRRCRFMSG